MQSPLNQGQHYVAGPAISIGKWVTIAFLVRLALMLVVHFSGAEESLRLTRDAFLYDEVGLAISEYYVSGGSTAWPSRVTGVVDFGWEHFIGLVYYLFGYEPLLIKLVCVCAGALVPLVHCRTALIVSNDTRIGLAVLIISAFFPTQVYYSVLMVRDSVSALSVSMLFWGIAQFIRKTTPWWWVTFLIGFLVLISLRSYLASVLVVVIPLSFLVTAIFSREGRGRAIGGIAVIGLAVVASTVVVPVLVDGELQDYVELDTQFTDLDYINKVRSKMNRGAGAMYSDGSVTEVGSSLVDTATSFLIGLYFFFFSINPGQLSSIRQIMALPEVMLVIVGLWYGSIGAWVLWKERRDVFLPLILPTLVMTLGYSAATTNGGPLMRWRMQLLGVYLIVAATGLIASVRKKQMMREQFEDQSSGRGVGG
jgi:hypothetical protein